MPIQAGPATSQAGADENLVLTDANGAKFEFDQMDDKIIAATLKAFESGSLTPLIKEELRCTIQSRRLAEGKAEMKVEFKKPIKKKEMNEEEMKRALKRRQQNKEAAQRFRQRQKDTSDYLSAKIKRLESNSNSLADELKRLQEERTLLKEMLENHLMVCTNPLVLQKTAHQYANKSEIAIISNPAPTPSPRLPSCSSSIETTPLDHPSATPSPSISSYVTLEDIQSVTSSVTDSVITDGVPDTATSDSSVFFGDDDVSLGNLKANPAVVFATAEERMDDTVIYDSQCLDVGYEETVVNVDDTDSEFDEARRPESCSSADAIVCKDAVDPSALSANWTACLSQSMDIVGKAFIRAHLDSCSSQNFEPRPDDLFLLEDMTP